MIHQDTIEPLIEKKQIIFHGISIKSGIFLPKTPLNF